MKPRSRFARCGGSVAGSRPTALSDLLRATKKPNDLSREHAATLLGHLVNEVEASSALVPMLSDEKPNVRCAAVSALSRFGSEAAFAIPDIRKLLKDSDTLTVIAAAGAISRLDPAARDAVAALAEQLNDERVFHLTDVDR